MITTILKSFKIRAYPTAEQRRLFAVTEGATRYVRNRVLREMDEHHQATGRYKSVIDMSREVTQWKQQPETAWLADIPSDPIVQELRDLETAFKRFFKKTARYPKKKPKRFGCSTRFAFDHRHAGKVRAWNQKQLILPRLGAIKLAQPERIPAQMPKLMTLSRDGAGRYFVSFAVEVEIEPLPKTGVAIGIDVGIKALAVENDGTKHDGAKALHRKLRHLKRQQRRLSRRVGARKGETPSNRYKKQARKLARLHARIADIRRDVVHKISFTLVKKADVIALEDLNVKGMLANHRLARHITDQMFAELRRQIEYKSQWHGKTVLYADRWAPTSKTCSKCGWLHDMPLHKRVMSCECGLVLDRDVNAAINILEFSTRGSTGVTYNARGQGKNLSDEESITFPSGTLDESRKVPSQTLDCMEQANV